MWYIRKILQNNNKHGIYTFLQTKHRQSHLLVEKGKVLILLLFASVWLHFFFLSNFGNGCGIVVGNGDGGSGGGGRAGCGRDVEK